MIESDLPNNKVQGGSGGSYAYAISQNKGMRNGEDAIVTSGTNGVYNISILMDGHGGQDVMRHAGQHLQDDLLTACADPAGIQAYTWPECVRSCFISFQNKIRQRRLRGGAAVVVMFVHLESMQVAFAWAGDAEAVIFRQGRVRFRSTRHGLENSDERSRIETHVPKYSYVFDDGYLCSPSGPCVMPTRGLGDVDMEVAGFISLPEVSDFIALEAGDVVLLASDGIWDILDAEYIAERFATKAPATEMLTVGIELAEAAVKQWIRTYGRASEADDISLLIFQPPSNLQHDAQALGGQEVSREL